MAAIDAIGGLPAPRHGRQAENGGRPSSVPFSKVLEQSTAKPENPKSQASGLRLDRVAEARAKMEAGAYRDKDVLKELAERLTRFVD